MSAEKNMTEILEELRKPFHPSRVTWKPGSLARDKSKAMALAYADLRAYQDRLDEVCGMDWSVSYTPWGERIVCHLTIHGITRSSTGEPDMVSERSEIAGTVAEAQAFKRACAMFGLGRYLYHLPVIWAEYDAERNQFTEKSKKRLSAIIAQHYQRTLNGEEELPEATLEADEAPAQMIREAAPETAATNGHQNGHVNGTQNGAHKSNGTHAEAVAVQEPSNGVEPNEKLTHLRDQFDELGQALYGEQWTRVRDHNVQRISGGKAKDSGALTVEQIQKLIKGMQKLQRQRQVAA